nr:hypothetical protein [Tanacetum cinerariifolium]
GKEIVITESSVRRDLQLADKEGINCLPNSIIFEQLALMGMIRNLDNVSSKILMYPRFLQIFLDQQLDGVPTHKRKFSAPSNTEKIFRNMRRIDKGFSSRATPLFPKMVIQNQYELGEGSTIPTDPHHTPIILQPSSSQPKKTQKPRKPKRKDTQVPQPSSPTESVTDEVVHKELGDSLVRAATTTSSLEAEQDNGNLTKTQSKETPNEPSSQRTNSGGGPRCQETIRDTTDQTRFKNVSKNSNDSLLVRGSRENAASNISSKTIVEYSVSTFVKLRREKEQTTNTSSTEKDNVYLPKEHERIQAQRFKLKEFDSIQEMFDKSFKRVNIFEDFKTKLVEGKEKRAGTELEQEITKKQKLDDDIEKPKVKHLMESIPDKEEVAIDAIPLAIKSLRIIDWKIYKKGKKSYYQIIYMLVEKKYPFTPPTLSMILEKKLQIDYESEMAYQLCKLIKKQLKK